jgi:hypothetical protein
MIEYVPSQSERADAMHICQCPCACQCSDPLTSTLNRTRQIRALISGACCQSTVTSITVRSAGTNYAKDDILQLQGGNPLDKPALFRVTSVNNITGAITGIVLIYNQPYRIKPSTVTMIRYAGTGTGTNAVFDLSWASCQSPANLYRQ